MTTEVMTNHAKPWRSRNEKGKSQLEIKETQTVAFDFYAVKKGKGVRNCIFLSWDDCNSHVEHFDDASYSVFNDIDHAVSYVLDNDLIDFKNMYMESQCSEEDKDSGQREKTASTEVDKFEVDGNKKCTKRKEIRHMMTEESKNSIGDEGQTTCLHPSVEKECPTKREKVKKDSVTENEETTQLSDRIDTDENTPLSQLRKRKADDNNYDHGKRSIQKPKVGKTVVTNKNPTKYEKNLDEKWEENFSQLVEYASRCGTTDIPSSDKCHADLFKWINQQRNEYRKIQASKPSRLTIIQMQRLYDIGFRFGTKRVYLTWKDRFELLQEFYAVHRHVKVPVRHPELGNWVHSQRREYNLFLKNDPNSTMTKERLTQLTSLGFVFEVAKKKHNVDARSNTKTWDERFQELLVFRQKFGHTIVPQNFPSLGWWVNTQRKEYKKLKIGKKSLLTTERALKLAEIGFVFDASGRKGGSYITASSGFNNVSSYDVSETKNNRVVSDHETLVVNDRSSDRNEYSPQNMDLQLSAEYTHDKEMLEKSPCFESMDKNKSGNDDVTIADEEVEPSSFHSINQHQHYFPCETNKDEILIEDLHCMPAQHDNKHIPQNDSSEEVGHCQIVNQTIYEQNPQTSYTTDIRVNIQR